METKICSKCKAIKSVECFGNKKQCKDGKEPSCRSCISETKRNRRQSLKNSDPNLLKKMDAESYRKYKETNYRCDQKWKKANPEKRKQHKRNYYERYYLGTERGSVERFNYKYGPLGEVLHKINELKKKLD